jgi:hypothetical protein
VKSEFAMFGVPLENRGKLLASLIHRAVPKGLAGVA